MGNQEIYHSGEKEQGYSAGVRQGAALFLCLSRSLTASLEHSQEFKDLYLHGKTRKNLALTVCTKNTGLDSLTRKNLSLTLSPEKSGLDCLTCAIFGSSNQASGSRVHG